MYKLFDSPLNHMIMIGNESELHYKVVVMIRPFYPDSLLVVGLGENRDTEDKRLDSWKKGYMKGQPDLMVLDYHKDFGGLCIEFKGPTNVYRVSDVQKDMKKRYVDNGYAFILSNNYDKICMYVYMSICGASEYHANTAKKCSILRKHEKHIIKLSTDLRNHITYYISV